MVICTLLMLRQLSYYQYQFFTNNQIRKEKVKWLDWKADWKIEKNFFVHN